MGTPEQTPHEQHRFTRSALLKGGGALIVLIAVPAAAWRITSSGSDAPTTWPTELDPASLDSWLAIHADGTVTAFTGKTELGQGNRTALSQIVAEELDVPFDRVRMVMGDTATCVDQGPTVGSLTIALAGPQLRQAAADGRHALVTMAATRLDVPARRLTVADGIVSDGSRRVSYGELIDGRLLGVAIPVKGKARGFGLALGGARPKSVRKYRIVGESVPRVDIPPKVTGEHFYIQDVRVPGMLHGRVIRPPGLGSQLISHGEPSRGAQVVRLKNFLGVVAEREWDAIRAAEELEVKWSDWAGLPTMDEVYSYIRETPSLEDTVVAHKGDAARALAGASRRFDASYTTAVQTHGSIGPSCAVADVKDGSATVWSGTQGPNVVRAALADALDIPVEKVHVITYEASGCYGRNGSDPATIDAAMLCKMVDRGQITGGLVDGPLAFDNAVSEEAARIQKIASPVAGRADILLVPDLEAGNMVAKELQYLAGADSAGMVLGARVPIVLTSRADSVRSRIASCAVAMRAAHARRRAGRPA